MAEEGRLSEINEVMMNDSAINLERKLEKISEFWSPKIIAQLNDYHFKLAKVRGEFVWHSHAETDEAFIVLDGELTIEMRNGQATIKKGEIYIVPKGVEHRPVAKEECHLMLIEPAGTLNTGDAGGDLTASKEWL
jgi:mannose-6-phosphate isomerase-like protein (cupin superfamily)